MVLITIFHSTDPELWGLSHEMCMTSEDGSVTYHRWLSQSMQCRRSLPEFITISPPFISCREIRCDHVWWSEVLMILEQLKMVRCICLHPGLSTLFVFPPFYFKWECFFALWPDVTPGGWLGSKHQPTTTTLWPLTCFVIIPLYWTHFNPDLGGGGWGLGTWLSLPATGRERNVSGLKILFLYSPITKLREGRGIYLNDLNLFIFPRSACLLHVLPGCNVLKCQRFCIQIYMLVHNHYRKHLQGHNDDSVPEQITVPHLLN